MSSSKIYNHNYTCRLNYVKRGGAVLAAGSLIARLDLDDSSKVLKVSEMFFYTNSVCYLLQG